ncbi:MAG: stage III sporulation protein AB [Eubacteriales bacterium]
MVKICSRRVKEMILKIIGLIIIFLSCFFIGNLFAAQYEKRYKQLLIFQQIIEYFETEIAYTSTPVIDVMESLDGKIMSPIREIIHDAYTELKDYGYRPLSDVWKDALQRHKDYLAINNEDMDIFIYFGNTLGTTDGENQKKYFHTIHSRINTQIKEAETNKIKYKKLFIEVGIIAGLFIIILII